MNVATLENCKRLYELSGQTGDDRWYMTDPDGKVMGTATPRILKHDRDYENGYRTDTPAYDCGYLLRKLPAAISPRVDNRKERIRTYFLFVQKSPDCYIASYNIIGNSLELLFIKTADTPEDALCLLAIKLFEQGILERGGSL